MRHGSHHDHTPPLPLTPYHTQIEVEELRATRTGLATELTNLQDRLDQAIAAHARTLHQLEIAKFFLQVGDPAPRMGYPSYCVSAGVGRH